MPTVTSHSGPSPLDVTVDHFTPDTSHRRDHVVQGPTPCEARPSLAIRRMHGELSNLCDTHYTAQATHSRSRARTASVRGQPDNCSRFPTCDEDRSLTTSRRSACCGLGQHTTQSNVRHRHVRLARIRRRAESSPVATLVGHDRLRFQRWHVPGAHIAGSAGQEQTRVARTCFDRRRQRARHLGLSAHGLAESVPFSVLET